MLDSFFCRPFVGGFSQQQATITNEGVSYKVYYNVSDAADNKTKREIRMVIVEIF